ncbi:hypothetical protein Ga0061061_105216 [Chelatococcus sambhunathii]|uniref:Antitoxin FitA-like ribbon-helix-helix domain-containing protein n=2 Tax=Chelatococcus TaxID=28209 RepID=A0AAC9NY21_9HYPH|nr:MULTISPECIES: hypothetical protein [Chelatococcus]APF36111.1 hypothetical protein BOQ54_01170 [Chelatococcus daeguensis]CUA88797.1 hypothetical protein Ga0061061_105216 [Chelatococcus sambhunathii]
MGQVLIRNLDDEVIEGLKVKARLAGVSFETFMRDLLKTIAPLSADEKIALIEEFRRQHGPLGMRTPPEDLIREERERR